MDNMINGIDVKLQWGMVIENAVTQFGFKMPDAKESLEVDLPDADGKKKDLQDRKFKAREFNLRCVMTAPTPEDLLENFRSLFTFFKIGGTYQFYNTYLNATAYIYYVSQVPDSGVYKCEEGVAIRFGLTFGETDPLANIPDVYLVDHLDRILVP